MSVIPSPISSTSETPKETDSRNPAAESYRNRRLFYACKRCFDIALACVMLVLLLPFGLLIALLIKLNSHGPALFVNRAMGQHGREFSLYKFRSMRPTPRSESECGDVVRNLVHGLPTTYRNGEPVYKMAVAENGRITRVGRFLRRTSLDELPQLWNILRGDLSFVGPRPSLPDEVAFYNEWQKQRLLVPQGLTGLYQVTARNRVPVEEMIRIDLEYIRMCSFLLDLKILLKTPPVMLSGL